MGTMEDLSSFALMFSNNNAGGKMPKGKKKSAPKMQKYAYKAKDGSLQSYSNSAKYQKKVGNVAAGKQAASEKAGRSRPVANKTAGMPNLAQRTDTMRGMPNKAQAVKKTPPTSAAQVRAKESGKNRSGGSAASKRKMESSSGMAGPKVTPRNIASARSYETPSIKVGSKNKPVGSARSVEQPRAKAATARTGSARGVESPSTPKKYGSARSVEQPMKKDRSNTSAAARRKMESRSR